MEVSRELLHMNDVFDSGSPADLNRLQEEVLVEASGTRNSKARTTVLACSWI